MNKKVLKILTSVLLIFSLLPLGAFAEDEPTEVVREFSNITFDSGSINASNFLYYANIAKGGYGLSVVKDSETNDNVLMMKHKKDSTLSNGTGVQLSCPGSYLSSVKIGGKFVLEYDIKFENLNSTCRLFIIEFVNGNTWHSGPAVNLSGEVVLNDADKTVAANVELNTWYRVKCVVDVTEAVCRTYLDDRIIEENNLGEKVSEGFKYVTLPKLTGLSASNESIIYLDNIRVYNIPNKYTFEIFTLKDDFQSQGADGFPLSGASLKIKFSEDMQETISKEDFIFLSDGQKVEFDLAYDKENCEVIITPKKDFKGRENCEISFGSIKTALGVGAKDSAVIEFVAAPPIYGIAEISSPEFTPGEDANVTIYVKNHTDSPKEGVIFLGFYKEGRLITVSSAGVNVPSDFELYTDLELDISVPEDYTDDGYELKAFLIKSNSFFIVDVLAV